MDLVVVSVLFEFMLALLCFFMLLYFRRIKIYIILAKHDDNFYVLAAYFTINVASAVAMLHLHTAPTVFWDTAH